MKQKDFIWYTTEVDETEMQKVYQEWLDINGLSVEEAPAFSDWLVDEKALDWNDFEDEIKDFEDCVCFGTIQKWNGRYNIKQTVFNTVLSAIEKCINEADFVEIKWCSGHIEIEAAHHDGTNTFQIYLLNDKGINAGERANLLNKTYHKRINI